MLAIKLFGSAQAQYFDRRIAGFPHQLPSLLLCYLLLHKNYPINRESLSAVFWSDHSAQASRKALRNTLWRLRQTLQGAGAPADDYLLISEESVAFINTSRYWLDVEAFDHTIGRYQNLSGEELAPQQAAEIEAVLNLYTGDLLSNVYDDWILFERERLSLLFLNALSKLMVFYGSHECCERGLACGERILARDNTREKIHRQMMWLYCLSGDRNAALVHYKRCCQILRDELGVDPMAETRQLFEQILHNQFDAAHWLTFRNSQPATPSPSSNLNAPLAEQLLERLHLLQVRMDETNAELRSLEKMIGEALSQGKPTLLRGETGKPG